MPEPILDVQDLSYSFKTYGGEVEAVRGVSFRVFPGEVVGIVGESGCGKSVSAQCALRLNPEPPGFHKGGRLLYKGRDVFSMGERELRAMRGAQIGFVFQDPMTYLNPTMKVGAQVEEVFAGRPGVSRKEARRRAAEMLGLVGISDVERRRDQYPHELSGGMKQRVMIAMALVGGPDLVIADEPTTSLDVTIEAQILELLDGLRKKLDTAIVLITHDLGVIAKMCDRVYVMYGGKVVESGPVEDIFYRTAHPYTAGLLGSIARLETECRDELKAIEGTPPDLFSPPPGCPFAARCDYAMRVCYERPAPEYDLGGGHRSACWLRHEYAAPTDLSHDCSPSAMASETIA